MEKTIAWIKETATIGYSSMIDQTIIPYSFKRVNIKTSVDM